jgi:23S rRNA (pseudouridine1915-N3)-methyltransferase
VGTRMPRWVDEAFAEYAKRMPHALRLELIELRPEPRSSGKPPVALLRAEAARIRSAMPQGAFCVVLDERGREFTSQAFAQWLGSKADEGSDLALVIGGPDGLSPELKAGAQLRLRLSALTLAHGLARVVLAEQIYRAVSILRHHPYHRE